MLLIPMAPHDEPPTDRAAGLPDRRLDAPFDVTFVHRIRMTTDAFDPGNPSLRDVLDESESGPHRALVVIDDGVCEAWPALSDRIEAYAAAQPGVISLQRAPVIVPGGEQAKNNWEVYHAVTKAIDEAGICRRSYVLVIGGGAVQDAAGFAAATAHRGVRVIRFPTTTLSQGDSGIGVKCAINAFGKKNFLGVFAPPWAVINDEQFLTTLSDRHWRSGLSEAVKVGLVKDAALFETIEQCVGHLRRRDAATGIPIIRASAELHVKHIVEGGDPFEITAARPLDFGHWAAHKLESMTGYELTHGEAVAIGMALDVTYASLIGLLDAPSAERILRVLRDLGFDLHHQAMTDTGSLFAGLDEFREHLGGELTIPLLRAIGEQVDINSIDLHVMKHAIDRLAVATTDSASA